MIFWNGNKSFKLMTLVALFATLPMALAHGACNNPANWLQPPTTGVKVFVGDERELPFGFATRFTGALREFKIGRAHV